MRYQPRCQPAETANDYEECQQAEGIRASEDQAKWAFWQVVIGAAGVLSVIATLVYTARAARAAEEAAIAAHEAVRQGAKGTRQTIRAYVHAKTCRLHWFDNGARFVVELVNTGQTPATFFAVSGKAYIFDYGAVPSEFPQMRDFSAPWTGLGAGEANTVPIDDKTLRRSQLSTKGDNFVQLVGTVRYGTVFGEVVETDFDFFVPWKTGELESKMQRGPSAMRAYDIVESPHEQQKA